MEPKNIEASAHVLSPSIVVEHIPSVDHVRKCKGGTLIITVHLASYL